MTAYHTEQALTAHILADASGSTARVYQYLRNAQVLAERFGRTWITPRAKTIADDLGRHVRTVRRALADLKARGAISVQPRFARHRDGRWRQISNRLRVMVTVVAATTLRAKIRERQLTLFKCRSDNNVTPRTEEKNNGVVHKWTTSPLYRQLVAAGLKSHKQGPV